MSPRIALPRISLGESATKIESVRITPCQESLLTALAVGLNLQRKGKPAKGEVWRVALDYFVKYHPEARQIARQWAKESAEPTNHN